MSRRWSKAEDEFLIANCSMTAAVAGAHLGRTEGAVVMRRVGLRGAGATTTRFGRNLSPTNIGSRPLLAKTCLGCGLLLQAQWFAKRAASRTNKCVRCRATKVQRQRPSAKAAQDRYQALTIPGASHSGEPWSGPDLAILQNPDMTLMQKALMTRRTYSAVTSKCHSHGYRSHVGLGDPERDQWKIDNPNADTFAA